MLLKQGTLTANIDVNIPYTFEPLERGTFVVRDLDLTIHSPEVPKVAEPRVLVQPEVRGRPPIVGIPPLQAHCSSTTSNRLNFRLARHPREIARLG